GLARCKIGKVKPPDLPAAVDQVLAVGADDRPPRLVRWRAAWRFLARGDRPFVDPVVHRPGPQQLAVRRKLSPLQTEYGCGDGFQRLAGGEVHEMGPVVG